MFHKKLQFNLIPNVIQITVLNGKSLHLLTDKNFAGGLFISLFLKTTDQST